MNVRRKYLAKRSHRRPQKTTTLIPLIKKVLKGSMETKVAMLYGGSQNASTPPVYDYAQASPVQQNQFISSNLTDILRVIPPIVEGTDDFERIGTSIQPVSLQLKCNVTMDPKAWDGSASPYAVGRNLIAVAYLLQHKQIKSYTLLSTQNNFSQLLDSGDGSTRQFSGTRQDAMLPVASQYYKLLKKKTIPLRIDGNVPNGTTGSPPWNAQSDPFSVNWTWTLKGKSLPKKLRYPESNTAAGAVAAGVNDPTNCSLFWCVAFYNMDGTSLGTAAQTFIQQQYVATLRYKDA